MNEIYNILDKADFYLKKLKKIEQYGVYLLLVIILSALFAVFILPTNSKKIHILDSKITTLENALKNNERALQDNEQEKMILKGIERSNASIKEEINNNEQAIKYIDKKIEEQHNIKFSSTQWGVFYKDIQKKAIKNNIKITSIQNEKLVVKVPKTVKKDEKKEAVKKVQNTFRPIFTLKIEGIATFKDLMKFLVDAEKNKLITKLNVLNIASYDPKTLKFHLEINLWGIK